MSSFICVSYATPHYVEDMRELGKSLARFGLEHDLVEVPDRGSWQKNTCYKPTFINSMLKKYDKDIVWLDADSRVLKYPQLFEELSKYQVGFSFAGHWRKPEGFLSGTLYFTNSTDHFNYTVSLWGDVCEEHPDRWDQKSLDQVSCGVEGSDPMPQYLPVEYCYLDKIHQHEYPDLEPVILHLQRSRELKKLVDGVNK